MGIEPGPHWWEASALNTAPYTLFSITHGSDFFNSLHLSAYRVSKIGITSLTMAQARQFEQDAQEGIIVNSVSKRSGSGAYHLLLTDVSNCYCITRTLMEKRLAKKSSTTALVVSR